MAGIRFSPACSMTLEPLAVWGLARRSRHRSARVLPPVSAPPAPPPLLLQLLLQLVEKAPVGPLGDNLLRARLDHPGLVQAQGVKAHRILGVILAPLAVGKLLHGLE